MRLVNDDPPDAEVLVIGDAGEELDRIPVEVARYGSYSRELTDVIKQKLRNTYKTGTVIVVLVEEAENIVLDHVGNEILDNNPHKQMVVVDPFQNRNKGPVSVFVKQLEIYK